jgi:hypothetical protein
VRCGRLPLYQLFECLFPVVLLCFADCSDPFLAQVEAHTATITTPAPHSTATNRPRATKAALRATTSSGARIAWTTRASWCARSAAARYKIVTRCVVFFCWTCVRRISSPVHAGGATMREPCIKFASTQTCPQLAFYGAVATHTLYLCLKLMICVTALRKPEMLRKVRLQPPDLVRPL